MKIVIAGGGDVGVKIAEKLIYENHDVTILEKDPQLIRTLQSKLDAMIISGDATNINALIEANILNADSFIAVTNNDSENLLACNIVKKCCKKNISITCKIDSYFQYFNEEYISPKDFGIETIIKPLEITVAKIMELMNNPNVFEIMNYADNMAQLVGVKVKRNFKFRGIPISEISSKDNIFSKVRLVAIQREGKLIVPNGQDVIYPKDKLYLVGKTDIVKKIVEKHFSSPMNLKNIIIVGGTKHAIELSKALNNSKKNITIIEEDKFRCKKLSFLLDNVLIMNGSATDSHLMDEVSIEDSCVISMSDNDEYNILSAFTAKKYGASKTMCMVKNSFIVNLINNLDPIDTVFSPHALTIGEILKHTRKTDLFSVSPFTEIDAETIGINVTQNSPILNIPIKDITFPEKSIIGVIIRESSVIIPTGDDIIKLGDKVIVFLLPESIYEVEKMFSNPRFGGRR
ncbi:MAG: Trk system potassium transporter TrkA [Psychrilyobacter sp.]|uniref:Trk system potassium transporter TrkA n=1 Tax=Psychrilyobacter sp. TaxID=2586924 RepID=UPI003C734981